MEKKTPVVQLFPDPLADDHESYRIAQLSSVATIKNMSMCESRAFYSFIKNNADTANVLEKIHFFSPATGVTVGEFCVWTEIDKLLSDGR